MANINITGFKNINFAPMATKDSGNVRPTYETPIAIKGAKSCEITLNFESIAFYSDDVISYSDNYFTNGEVSLVVSGLTASEYAMLFGNKQAQGGLTVNANDIATEGALMFEKKILGTNHTRKFVVYGVKMSPASITAETLADSITEAPVELTGTCRMLSTGEIYSMIDTNSPDYDATLDNWYEEVKFLEDKPVVKK